MKIQPLTAINDAKFAKSTYSNGSDNCVEVAAIPGITAVQDTKDRAKGRIVVSHGAFEALVLGLKTGHLS